MTEHWLLSHRSCQQILLCAHKAISIAILMSGFLEKKYIHFHFFFNFPSLMGNMRLASTYNERPAKPTTISLGLDPPHNAFLIMGYPYNLFWSTFTTITHLWSWVMVPSLTFCVGSSTPITHLCFWFIVPTFTTSWGLVAPLSYIFGNWVWCQLHAFILIIEHDQEWLA